VEEDKIVKPVLRRVSEREAQKALVRAWVLKRPASMLKKPAGVVRRKRTPYTRERKSRLLLGGSRSVLRGTS